MSSKSILALLIIIACTAPALAHEQHETHEGLKGGIDVYSCLQLNSVSERITCYKDICEPSYKCGEQLIAAATEFNGAEDGMRVLDDIMSPNGFNLGIDGHEYAHEVGRATGRSLGLTGEAFLSCPSDYNYGCQHGFFEAVMSTTPNIVDAATSICEHLPENIPQKDYFYCYHGVGHGVLIAAAYNLTQGLAWCDALPTYQAQDGCWQGLFMENINGAMTEEELGEGFLSTDPLAPCNQLDEKYGWECYINHAGYLMSFFNNNIQNATHACTKAVEQHQHSCIQSLALMTTNPGWQQVMAQGKYEGDVVEIAAQLCNDFPQEFYEDCIFGGIDNLHNFDNANVQRPIQFCSLINDSFHGQCYNRIGHNLRLHAANEQQRVNSCLELPDEYHEDCIGETKNEITGMSIVQEVESQPLEEEPTVVVEDVTLTVTKEKRGLWSLSGLWQKIKGLFREEEEEEEVESRHEDQEQISGNSIVAFEADAQRLMDDDEYVRQALQKQSLVEIMAQLNEVSYGQGIDCHNRAHEVGRLAYEELGQEAFKQCGNECHSGCRHGATEAFFAEKGTKDLQKNLQILCSDEANDFFTHQCLHGIGHGLMAWTNYDLPMALKACDILNSQSAQSSCWSGVFMENIVGGVAPEVGHETNYLSDDPHYPCNIVEDHYRPGCYFLQTSHMVTLFSGDFAKVAAACSEALTTHDKLNCFQSMGRDVSGHNQRTPKPIIETCRSINHTQYEEWCIIGALQDQMWDPTQSEKAINFCYELIGTDMEENCYYQIMARAADVIFDDHQHSEFCKALPNQYQESCTVQVPSYGQYADLTSEEAGQDLVIPQAIDMRGQRAVIEFGNKVFSPEHIIINEGQKVTWVNNDDITFWPASNIHPTHRAYPGSDIEQCEQDEHMFDACEPLSHGKQFSFTFNEVGTWFFHDHINPSATGSVTVME